MSELADAVGATAQEWRERYRLAERMTLPARIQGVLDDELLAWYDDEDQAEGWATDGSPETLNGLLMAEVVAWLRERAAATRQQFIYRRGEPELWEAAADEIEKEMKS